MGRKEREQFIKTELGTDNRLEHKDAARRWESFAVFKKQLEGWMASPDGQDYCPKCWPQFLEKFEPKHRGMVIKDARPTAAVAEPRKSSDGWLAICESCGTDVFTPY